MRRFVGMAALALMLGGCGAAAGGIAPGALGVSARDAYVEARSVARSWAPESELRWVEGEDIGTDGIALPESGVWTFHYTAPGETRDLRVRVTPLETMSEERPVTGPPGYILGDNVLDTSWIDSRRAMAGVEQAAASALDAPVSVLLVPTRPPQWIVEIDGTRWRVHAETGEVLER
ncbi:MAG: hypothetical protein ACLFRX_05665 [Gemmatimonadota bacterium]